MVSIGIPCLKDVLLVEGLTANIISISQICNQFLNMEFNKVEFIVTHKNGEMLMKGSKSKDNCYMWTPQPRNMSSTCESSKHCKTKITIHEKEREVEEKDHKVFDVLADVYCCRKCTNLSILV